MVRMTEEQKETRRMERREAWIDRQAQREQFWEQAFLAATQQALEGSWGIGEPPSRTPWNTITQRARVAALYATDALTERDKAFP